MYLESFTLPSAETEEKLMAKQAAHNGGIYGYLDNTYPCRIFPGKELRELWFRPITFLYGGNGSGKSTLLNLIAEKLLLTRSAPFNSGEMFPLYADACTYSAADDSGAPQNIPDGSRIITSDDIFDYMLSARMQNDELREQRETAKEDYAELKFGKTIRFNGMEDYDNVRLQLLARSRSVSRRQFLQKTLGNEVRLGSNGETALRFFETKLENDTLYLLDEPENSLSPKMQQELCRMLSDMARFCGCQFVIATHSPFLLAAENARIYDLDTVPVMQRNWWELENVRCYYEFFRKNRQFFE